MCAGDKSSPVLGSVEVMGGERTVSDSIGMATERSSSSSSSLTSVNLTDCLLQASLVQGGVHGDDLWKVADCRSTCWGEVEGEEEEDNRWIVNLRKAELDVIEMGAEEELEEDEEEEEENEEEEDEEEEEEDEEEEEEDEEEEDDEEEER